MPRVVSVPCGERLGKSTKELVKSVEDLREKREELNRQILKDGAGMKSTNSFDIWPGWLAHLRMVFQHFGWKFN